MKTLSMRDLIGIVITMWLIVGIIWMTGCKKDDSKDNQPKECPTCTETVFRTENSTGFTYIAYQDKNCDLQNKTWEIGGTGGGITWHEKHTMICK